jgi:hypothetical protein
MALAFFCVAELALAQKVVRNYDRASDVSTFHAY